MGLVPEKQLVEGRLPPAFVFDKALDGGISPYYRNHMYLQGGMNLKANSWLTLAPSVLFRSTPNIPSVLDFNLVTTVSESYTLGLGYRTGNSFVLLTQCRISNQFRIGYTRDFTATDIEPTQVAPTKSCWAGT